MKLLKTGLMHHHEQQTLRNKIKTIRDILRNSHNIYHMTFAGCSWQG